jgi:hypothetical protein
MEPFCFFGHSILLPPEREDIRTLEILTPDDVKEVVRAGVIPCYDKRYSRCLRALRRLYGIRLPQPPAERQHANVGDVALMLWIEASNRLPFVDPRVLREEQFEDACYFFALEQIV